MVKNTNILLNHTLRLYTTSADDFGDPKTVGEAHIAKALVEDTHGFENADHIDSLEGSLLAFIEPTDTFYVGRGGKIQGLVAQFSRFNEYDHLSWYRIASVRPGESLIGGDADLVELTLTRIAEVQPYGDES